MTSSAQEVLDDAFDCARAALQAAPDRGSARRILEVLRARVDATMTLSTTSPGDEREAFETHFVSKFGTRPLTWRVAEGGPYDVPDGMQDNYYVHSTQQAWEAWQARAAISNSAAELDEEAERALFHADAEPMGFDLTRHQCAAPEPWSQYKDIDTGNRWGGWLARAATVQQVGAEWMPISGAPKDGSAVLVNDTAGLFTYCMARWLEGEEWEGWIYDDEIANDSNPLGPQPTHFMRIMAVPKSEQGDQQ
jgi:hypothetical protein